MPRPYKKVKCLHCKKLRWPQGRNLCPSCHRTPEIRALYPNLRGDGKVHPREDPTEAELEACIAEQRKCLPKWWEAAEKVQAAMSRGPKAFVIVRI